MVIQIINGAPVGEPQPNSVLQVQYPNTSFPVELTPTDVDPFGYGVYISTASPNPGTYQKAVQITPVLQSDQCWYQTWEVVDMTPEEIAAKNESLQLNNKNNASQLLSKTDWTTIPDVSDPAISDPYLTNAAEFAAYRSNVRKIAVNPPVTVDVWPVEPDEVWAYTNA